LTEQTVHILRPRPYPGLVSLVVPIFNEESGVTILRARLEQFIAELKCDAEIILVNDGSTDGTLAHLAAWAGDDRRIKVVQLSRNFGHQLAATAGLDYASGHAVILLDADLQDPPEVIHSMISHYCEGYDVVYGQRLTREGETIFKMATAWLFYRLMRMAVHRQLPADVGDFRLISQRFLRTLKSMRETHRFIRGMVAWLGHPQIAVKYYRAPRVAGETKYPLSKMLLLAWTAATSFSSLPLRLSFFTGLVFGLFGVEEACRAILAHTLGWYTVRGWTSTVVITCVLGSSMLMSISIIGEYVGKIYEEIKERPLYVVADTLNIGEDDSQSPATVLTARDSQV
jgi:polyisoprenyl-phosphate glycosyltransferase